MCNMHCFGSYELLYYRIDKPNIPSGSKILKISDSFWLLKILKQLNISTCALGKYLVGLTSTWVYLIHSKQPFGVIYFSVGWTKKSGCGCNRLCFCISSLCHYCVSFILSLLIGSPVLFLHVEYFVFVITCYCSVGLRTTMCICIFDVLVYVLDIDLFHVSHILFQTDTCIRLLLAAFLFLPLKYPHNNFCLHLIVKRMAHAKAYCNKMPEE